MDSDAISGKLFVVGLAENDISIPPIFDCVTYLTDCLANVFSSGQSVVLSMGQTLASTFTCSL